VSYSSTEVVTILAALGVLTSTIGASIVSIVVAVRTGKKMDDNTAVTLAASQSTHRIEGKTDVISTQTNGAAARAAAMIEDLQRQVVSLTASMAEHKQTAALLAQAVQAQGVRSAHRSTDDPLKVEVVNVPLATTTEVV